VGRTPSINIDNSELGTMFVDPIWAGKFPPLLSVETAAELADVSKATIYDWSSRGLLDKCAKRQGKRLRILRDRFVQFLFEAES
jgi:hypothetical protein